MAAQAITVKLLIAGIAALVPLDQGRMTVLVPTVDRVEWQKKGYYLPTHETWFGYWIPRDGVECKSGFKKEPTGETRVGSLCWFPLKGSVIKIDRMASGASHADDRTRYSFMGIKAKMPRNSHVEDVTDFSWIAEMSKVAPDLSVDPACLRSKDLQCPVSASIEIDYQKRTSCRLAGQFDRWRKKFGVWELRFESPTSAGYRQAVANASMFEIKVENSTVDIEIYDLKGNVVESLTLSTEETDETGEVHIAIATSIPDEELMRMLIDSFMGVRDERADDHFRAYHELASKESVRSMEVGDMPVPVRTQRAARYFDEEDIERQCPTPFLWDSKSSITYFEVATALSKKLGNMQSIQTRTSAIGVEQLIKQSGDKGSAIGNLLTSLGLDKPVVISNVPPRVPNSSGLALFAGTPLCPELVLESKE